MPVRASTPINNSSVTIDASQPPNSPAMKLPTTPAMVQMVSFMVIPPFSFSAKGFAIPFYSIR